MARQEAEQITAELRQQGIVTERYKADVSKMPAISAEPLPMLPAPREAIPPASTSTRQLGGNISDTGDINRNAGSERMATEQTRAEQKRDQDAVIPAAGKYSLQVRELVTELGKAKDRDYQEEVERIATGIADVAGNRMRGLISTGIISPITGTIVNAGIEFALDKTGLKKSITEYLDNKLTGKIRPYSGIAAGDSTIDDEEEKKQREKEEKKEETVFDIYKKEIEKGKVPALPLDKDLEDLTPWELKAFIQNQDKDVEGEINRMKELGRATAYGAGSIPDFINHNIAAGAVHMVGGIIDGASYLAKAAKLNNTSVLLGEYGNNAHRLGFSYQNLNFAKKWSSAEIFATTNEPDMLTSVITGAGIALGESPALITGGSALTALSRAQLIPKIAESAGALLGGNQPILKEMAIYTVGGAGVGLSKEIGITEENRINLLTAILGCGQDITFGVISGIGLNKILALKGYYKYEFNLNERPSGLKNRVDPNPDLYGKDHIQININHRDKSLQSYAIYEKNPRNPDTGLDQIKRVDANYNSEPHARVPAPHAKEPKRVNPKTIRPIESSEVVEDLNMLKMTVQEPVRVSADLKSGIPERDSYIININTKNLNLNEGRNSIISITEKYIQPPTPGAPSAGLLSNAILNQNNNLDSYNNESEIIGKHEQHLDDF